MIIYRSDLFWFSTQFSKENIALKQVTSFDEFDMEILCRTALLTYESKGLVTLDKIEEGMI